MLEGRTKTPVLVVDVLDSLVADGMPHPLMLVASLIAKEHHSKPDCWQIALILIFGQGEEKQS